MRGRPAAEHIPTHGRRLALPHVAQIGHRWCWAACVEMVLTGCGEAQRQSAIVAQELGHHGCCDRQPTRPACDQALGPDRVTAVWHRYGFTGARRRGRLRYPELSAELERGGPVEAGLGDAALHTVLLVGYRTLPDGTGLVAGLDPWAVSCGPFWVPYPTLLEEGVNGHGPWRLSWVGIRRASQ